MRGLVLSGTDISRLSWLEAPSLEPQGQWVGTGSFSHVLGDPEPKAPHPQHVQVRAPASDAGLKVETG